MPIIFNRVGGRINLLRSDWLADKQTVADALEQIRFKAYRRKLSKVLATRAPSKTKVFTIDMLDGGRRESNCDEDIPTLSIDMLDRGSRESCSDALDLSGYDAYGDDDTEA